MKTRSVHFIGIGGIGVSALAKYYLSQGVRVSGSDLVAGEITKDLQKKGAKIVIGAQRAANLPKNVSLVIYTSATAPNNPELLAAQKRLPKAGDLAVKSYPEAVGELTRNMQTVTVSGSHGKSTTTALAALVLENGYLDPTVIVGTKLKEFGHSNFRPGKSPYLVLEADEWNKSFLNYSPTIALVTNIDAEHLDTYKQVEEVEKTFAEYLARVPAYGKIIANYDDPRLRRVASAFKKRVIWYSLKDKEAEILRKILRIPGEHNISNALAALKLGRALAIPEPLILAGLSHFTGTWRRFEFRGSLNGAQIFDDYGHHPAEIMATIKAARSRFPFRRIWCVFQPHQYQRLNHLWDNFASAFDLADRVCLLPVYDVAGRETKEAREAVNSEKLAEVLLSRGKDVCHLADFTQARLHLAQSVRPGDVVLMMGAGDIYNLTGQLFTA